MPDRQRIHVVSSETAEPEVLRLKTDLGRDPLVLTAPTGGAKRVVTLLGVEEPTVEVQLAPVAYPRIDRGDSLDTLVRRHALADRYRDVVVVCDPATITLLLRVLAPDQLPGAGGVSLVGLPRLGRQLKARRAIIVGAVAGIAAIAAERILPVLVIPAVLAVLGLVLLIAPQVRHLGREALVAAGVSFLVAIFLIAASARFPGAI